PSLRDADSATPRRRTSSASTCSTSEMVTNATRADSRRGHSVVCLGKTTTLRCSTSCRGPRAGVRACTTSSGFAPRATGSSPKEESTAASQSVYRNRNLDIGIQTGQGDEPNGVLSPDLPVRGQYDAGLCCGDADRKGGWP